MPFHDPIKPRKKVDGKSPWSFKAPSKDQAHSGNIPCGNDYGVGFRTPVGKEQASPMSSGPIPQQSKCWTVDETINKYDQRG